jgi:hypothetical protein
MPPQSRRNRRQLGQFDLQRFGGIPCLRQRFGDDEGEGITDITHIIVGENRLGRW